MVNYKLGKVKGEKGDTGDSPTIVDELQDGNLNAVTSNAVFDAVTNLSTNKANATHNHNWTEITNRPTIISGNWSNPTLDTNIASEKLTKDSIEVIHDLTDEDNLILKSREFVHNLGTVQTEKYQNNVVRYTDRTNQSSYLQYTWDIASGQFGYNDKFILTFFAKGTQSTSKLSAYFYGVSGYLQTRPIYHNGNSGSSVSFGDGRVTYDMDNAWKKYYVVWECNSTGDLSKTKRIAIRCGDGAELYLCGMSLKQLPTEYYDLIGSAITYINQ